MHADVPSAVESIRRTSLRAAAPKRIDHARRGNSARETQRRRVAITSWGALTPLGDLRETWERLLAGESLDNHARCPRPEGGSRRAARMALDVAASSLNGVRLDSDADAAVIVGTSKGSIEDWLSFPSGNAGRGLSSVGLADIAADLTSHLGLRGGPRLTISAACASGLIALIRGALMIQSGEARQALVVATEASVHPLFVGSFDRLGVLARQGEGCRPFDRNRSGFYMSEAAAAVVLEAAHEEAAEESSIVIDRFAIGGDATHITGGDPEARVLRHLLIRVLDGRAVDLIHAHGTGTEMNDPTELAAIDASVSDQQQTECPIVYSHKAALGHSLGASGLLGVVLNCVSHRRGVVPGNVRTTEPLSAARVTLPRGVTRRPVRRSVAVAAGFGGATAAVSLVSA